MSDTTNILPFVAAETTLENGLRVIVVPTGFPNLVSLQIPVQTGSRNEVEPGKSGFAHFFEHMMFRGTDRFPAEAYQAVITRAGARQNAYTTDDYTNYHITFAAEDLESILDLEADRFMNLKYSEEDFKTESRAILGEYNKSASDPLNKLIEVQREHAFTTHTYKHTTMGFLRDIEDMPNQFEYSRTFFDRWYRPEYTTVIIAGDVEPEAAVALVRKYWGAWQPGSVPPPVIPQEPAPVAPVIAYVPWTSSTLPWVTLAAHGPAFSDSEPDFAALDMLLDLSFGETSDIYHALVEVEQKVDQLFVYNPSTQDPSLVTVFARVKDPVDTPEIRDRLYATLAALRSEAVDPKRLSEAKSHARYGFVRTLDNSESVASTLARYVRFNRSYETLNALFRQYDLLTPEHLLAAAQRYLAPERLVQATLSHEPLPTGIEQLPAEPTSAGNESLPESQVVFQSTPSTLLRFKLLFETGSSDDPAGKEGLAALAGEMIANGGSQAMAIDEIAKALFPMAGSFEAQVDREMTTFTGVTHRDNLDAFVRIVLPQLLTPGFRADDFSRLREQQRNALIQDLRSNNDEELGKERLQVNLFAGTPYGHTTLGTVAGLEAITLEDVRAFVAERYGRANLTLGLSGDFPAESVGGLRSRLGALPPGTKKSRGPLAGRALAGIEVDIVQKDTRSTAISFGHPLGVTREHADFAALWLARAYLGEHRASVGRLYNRIRELRGMNYGDYAYVEAFPRGMHQFFPDPNRARRAQLFEVWIRPVPPHQAVFALKAAIFELRRLLRDGLTPEEFEDIRNYLKKNVYVMLKTQEQQVGYALDSGWFGMGDFAEEMRNRLDALTLDGTNGTIRRHFSGENLSVVMITGDAEALRTELLSGATATITYDAAKPAEVLAEDEVIGALDLGLTAERVVITPIDEVFA